MSTSRGRPRDPHTDERITSAAQALLRERGPAAVHVDSVSARSGIARSTIYRRYQDRRALMEAALAHFAEAPLPTADLPLEDKLRWMLDQVRELVEERLGRGAIAAVLADSDPDFSAALRARLADRLQALEAEIGTDVARGRIWEGTNVHSLAELVFGAYLGEVLQHGRARRSWADGVMAVLLHGLDRS